jgi:probable addiction module antidote protein
MAKITKFDAADYLKTKRDVVGYLNAVLEYGDPALTRKALNDISRSHGITEIAKETGMSRTSLYKAFAPDGNPSFTTVVEVLKAMGVSLSAHKSEHLEPAE